MRKLITVAVLGLLSMAACTTKNAKDSDELVPVDSLDHILISDEGVAWTDTFEVDDDNWASVALGCGMPKNLSQVVADSIKVWVCQAFGDSACDYFDYDVAYLLHDAGQAMLSEDSTNVANDIAEGTSYGDGVVYTDEIIIQPLYENDQYVTMSYEAKTQIGGPDISSYSLYATFSKKDGHQMGNELLKGMTEEQILKQIRETFDTSGEQYDPDDLRLPETPAYLTEDGVEMIYQENELSGGRGGRVEVWIKANE